MPWNPVDDTIWEEASPFRDLTPLKCSGQSLYLFCLTTKLRHSAGIWIMGPGVISDKARWPYEKVVKVLKELQAKHLILYDWEHHLIALVNWPQIAFCNSDSTAIMWGHYLAEFPSCLTLRTHLERVENYLEIKSKSFFKKFQKAFMDGRDAVAAHKRGEAPARGSARGSGRTSGRGSARTSARTSASGSGSTPGREKRKGKNDTGKPSARRTNENMRKREKKKMYTSGSGNDPPVGSNSRKSTGSGTRSGPPVHKTVKKPTRENTAITTTMATKLVAAGLSADEVKRLQANGLTIGTYETVLEDIGSFVSDPTTTKREIHDLLLDKLTNASKPTSQEAG